MRLSIRQASLPGFELGDYIREAVDFLRQHEPPEGFYVGFSGGKDSITALQLCRLAGVRHQAFYSCTRIDPPEMYTFIKAYYPEVRWLFPKESFWKMIVRKQPPFRHIRWCCDYLKKGPARQIPLKMRIMGVRAEESTRRASRPRIDSFNGQTTFKPIFHWPEWAVWEFIDAYRLPYPSLYDEGFGRIGCVVCPFILGKSPAQIANRKRSMERYPGIWKTFEYAVKRWCQRTIDSGLRENQKYNDPEIFWQRYISGEILQPRKNDNGKF